MLTPTESSNTEEKGQYYNLHQTLFTGLGVETFIDFTQPRQYSLCQNQYGIIKNFNLKVSIEWLYPGSYFVSYFEVYTYKFSKYRYDSYINDTNWL